MGITRKSKLQIHGFCDASESGYGAVIYLRHQNEKGQFQTALIVSKSRVAPLKVTTIPRLELCAAKLLSDLIFKISPMFEDQPITIFNWSDSKIVLCWLQKTPTNYKIFVANRIANIQKKTKEIKSTWHWISGKENPADLISRGSTCRELINNNLWWQGPNWLQQHEEKWPANQLEVEMV